MSEPPGLYCPICGAGPFDDPVSWQQHLDSHPPEPPPEPPALSGRVSQAWVLVAGERFPAGREIPVGASVAASLGAQNMSTIAIEVGFHWQLLDPTDPRPYFGAVRQDHNSGVLLAGPGQTVTFDGPAIIVDVPGEWFIYAELYGRLPGAAWQLLQELPLLLCVVGAVGPAEFRNLSATYERA